MAPPEHTSVLIVGGGLVGLSTALFLRYHGVDCILLERRDGASTLPRSRGVHTRTMELFRQIGVETRVREAAATAIEKGGFGGARRGTTLRDAEALDTSGLIGGFGADDSPTTFCFCPQVLLEPVLADIARERGADLRFGAELTEFAQDDDGVSATVAGAYTIHADHLIAADGANGSIGPTLGISGWTLPPTHHYLNLFAHADLSELVEGRTFSQCEIAGDTVRGVVLSKNNTDEWSFHPEYDPARESPADYSDERCVDLIRTAIGADVPVKLLARSAWDTGAYVAHDYRRGRVFLVGDAAHRFAPWGGFGANTGIADAHNLAWKLAATRAGYAAPSLLDSYQSERRPCALTAAEQAWLRTDFLTRYGVRTPDNADVLARHLDSGAIMTRYRYAGNAPVERLTGQVGTRLPHVWLTDGDRQVSTLDLYGPGFAVLHAGDVAEWRTAAEAAGVTAHLIGSGGLTDPDGDWTVRHGLPADGALLVRPDGHVAARSDDGLSPATLGSVLHRFVAI